MARLRLWPGVVVVALECLAFATLPFLLPDGGMLAVMGGAAGGLLVLIWWMFFSRAAWLERPIVVAFMILAVAATRLIVDRSISNGMMGFLILVYSIPVMSLALVLWAVMSRNLTLGPRMAAMVITVLLGCSVFTVIRTGGITGEGQSDFHWRWTATPEERLLASAPAATATAPVAPPPAPTTTEPASVPAPATTTPVETLSEGLSTAAANIEWPGFRGPNRDGVARGVRIDTDWSKNPPVQLWRHPIGPGWSSFAVQGNHIFTQEQRGDDEMVSCYDLRTGAPVWQHRDPVRFYESNGGPGPRGTPAIANGRVFSFGATGLLNALDARNGAVVWSRNAADDTHAKQPEWGFASSPVVVKDMVIVATSGVLAAYDVATGRPRWLGRTGHTGYSSPQLATIDGVPQVLLLTGGGVQSLALADGAELWNADWHTDGIVQPAVLGNDVLLGSGSGLNEGVGVRRVSITHLGNAWAAQERWTSQALKPYFNDFVVHNGFAFGFDGAILACLDLSDGKRMWKGGRYGHGQIVLLPDQDVLLVLSEEGELALVSAKPDQFTELARVPAIEGKTWNHPVLVGDTLLVRNGEEMAAFRLAVAGR